MSEPKSKLWTNIALSKADVLRKVERFEDSKQLYLQVLKQASRGGSKNQQAALCLNSLGQLAKKLGNYSTALKYLKAALKMQVALNGDSNQHASIGEILTNMGDVYRKQSEFSRAEAVYRRACDIFEKTVGNDHIEFAEACNSLGMVYKKLAHYDEAALWHDRALTIARATFKDKPSYKLGLFGHNRAEVERKRGNYDRALELYRESLKVIRQTLGPTHSENADTLHSMGLVYHLQGDYQTALQHITGKLTMCLILLLPAAAYFASNPFLKNAFRLFCRCPQNCRERIWQEPLQVWYDEGLSWQRQGHARRFCRLVPGLASCDAHFETVSRRNPLGSGRRADCLG